LSCEHHPFILFPEILLMDQFLEVKIQDCSKTLLKVCEFTTNEVPVLACSSPSPGQIISGPNRIRVIPANIKAFCQSFPDALRAVFNFPDTLILSSVIPSIPKRNFFELRDPNLFHEIPTPSGYK
jgi:hypothetical protein